MNEDGTPIIHNWAQFYSKVPGTYYFLLIATEDDKISTAVHTLIVGDGVSPEPPEPNPNPTPNPTIVVPEPLTYYKDLVKDIPSILVGNDAKKDGVELAKFYLDMADVIGRDENIIKTTSTIRQLHSNAGQLMFQASGMKDKYSNLNNVIDNVFVKCLGLENVSLTPEKRSSIVMGCRAIAWGVLQLQ